MKRIRGLLVASTLGLAAVEAPIDDSIGSANQAGQAGTAVTSSLGLNEALADGNGGPASDLNSDEDKLRRTV